MRFLSTLYSVKIHHHIQKNHKNTNQSIAFMRSPFFPQAYSSSIAKKAQIPVRAMKAYAVSSLFLS